MQRHRQLSQLLMHHNKHDLLSYAGHANYDSETHVKRRGMFSLTKFSLFLRELDIGVHGIEIVKYKSYPVHKMYQIYTKHEREIIVGLFCPQTLNVIISCIWNLVPNCCLET